MGINYRQLKAHGKSIVLERQENIVIERSDSQLFKRKQTVVREKFPHPNECDDEQRTTNKKQEKRRRRSKRGTGDENANTNENALVSRASVKVSESDSHETKLTQTAKQLSKLAHEIDIEIEKLKEQRDLIMHHKPQSPKQSPKRNAAIQNDMTWEQNLDANSNIEFTIEKYSSQHKFVCTSPRYGRDEQTSCRPRMRTIGLQKNTHRSNGGKNHKKPEEHPAAKCIATATAAAAAALTTKEASFPASLGGCFEYVNDGAPNVLNVYHNQHTHNGGGGGMVNDTGCRKYCQRYNATGNYNGLVCNQHTYVETGVSPCSEYNYCCDEYTYDYPNSCYVPLSVCCGPSNACGNCCTTTHACCSGRPRHSRSRSHHRRCSDLQTEDFARYCTTSPDKSKRDKSTAHKIEEKLTKKYMIAITERQKQLESDELRERGERHHDADKTSKSKQRSSKSKERRESKSKERHRASKAAAEDAKLEEDLREKLREESAAKISKYLTRGGCKNGKSGSDDDSDASSSLRKYKVKSKEKLLKITLTKQRQKHHISTRQHDSDDDCFGYTPSQCSIETLRTLKKMRITTYNRPNRQRQLKDEDTVADREQKDSGRRGKQQHRHSRKEDDDDDDDDDNDIDGVEKKPRDQRKKQKSPRDADRTLEGREDTLDAVGSDEGGKVRKYAEYIDKYKQGPDDELSSAKRAPVKEEPKDTQATEMYLEKGQPQRLQRQPQEEDYKIALKQDHSKTRDDGRGRLDEDDANLPMRAAARLSAEFEAGFAASTPSAGVGGRDNQQSRQKTPQVPALTPPHAIYDEQASSVKRDSVTFSPDTVARPAISPVQYKPQLQVSGEVLPQPQQLQVSREVLPQSQHLQVSGEVLPQPQYQQQYIPLPRHISDTSNPTRPIGERVLESGAAATPSQYDPSQIQPSQDRLAYERSGAAQGYPVGSPQISPHYDYDTSKIQSGQVGAYDRRDLQPPIGTHMAGPPQALPSSQGGGEIIPAYSGTGLPQTSSRQKYAEYDSSGRQQAQGDTYVGPTASLPQTSSRPDYTEYNASKLQNAQSGGAYERRDYQPSTEGGTLMQSALKQPTGYAPPGVSTTQVSSPYNATQIETMRAGGEIYDQRSRDMATPSPVQPQYQPQYPGGATPQYQPQYQGSTTPRPIYDDYEGREPLSTTTGGMFTPPASSTLKAIGPQQQPQRYVEKESPSTSGIQSQDARAAQFVPQRQIAPKVELDVGGAAQLQSPQSVMGIRRWDATAGRRPSFDEAYQQQEMQQRIQYMPQPQRFQYATQKCEESRVYHDGKDVRFNICGASEACYEDEELQCAEERELEVQGLVNLQCDTFEITSEYASARSSASRKRAPPPSVPEFTGCPCMLETYLNLVATYSNGRQRRNTAQCAKRTINC